MPKKKILTKRKAAWVEKRKPEILRGTPLNPNASDAGKYQVALERLVQIMANQTKKELVSFFDTEHAQEYFAQDASTASQARILMNAIMAKMQRLFDNAAQPEAERMADRASKSSSASVHASLKELSGGLSLPTTSVTEGQLADIWKASVAENVQLIKSISSEYLTQVQGAVMRSITTGQGLQELVPFLEKQKGITLRRARMIANDQTRKAFNSLSRARLQNLGLKKFEWLHTSGSREPRKLHEEMSGKIYEFDNPPVIDKRTGQRGYPGDAINCRCRMISVIDFEKD